jgi:hypothetical protein
MMDIVARDAITYSLICSVRLVRFPVPDITIAAASAK